MKKLNTVITTAALACSCVAALMVASANVSLARGIELLHPALPDNQRLRIAVLGDSFGAEVADGLRWALRGQDKIAIKKLTKPGTGLVRADVYDWNAATPDILSDTEPHIIIVALGGNDRQDIRRGGKRYERFSRRWKLEYLRRIESFASILAEQEAFVYWVGLPVVRSKRMSKDYNLFNHYYRDISESHGIKFISLTQRFSGVTGGFRAYGRGPRGRKRRIRDRDGIHFTNVGARVLGEFVGQKIKINLRAHHTDKEIR